MFEHRASRNFRGPDARGTPSAIVALRWGAPLAVALVLALIPVPRASALKALAARLLAPGQARALRARDWTLRTFERFADRGASADQQKRVSGELDRLRRRNRELEGALALTGLGAAAAAPDGEPLIATELVRARVLGRQARAFLQHAGIIDAGGSDGLFPGDLALSDAAPLIDEGSDGALEVDDLALSGRHVWGRLCEVDSKTARVRRVIDNGYRDVAQLAHWDGTRWHESARGVVEGTGEPLARVRMVALTAPVSVGDYVLAAGVRGTVTAPLIYGRVARVERAAGKTHWEIWMDRGDALDEPQRVAVLRLKLNSKRIRR